MRFAISIPQHVSDGAFDPAALRGYLARAEALGFESAWTQEQILGSSPRLGPIEVMSYAAACTERLRLGCAVFVTPLYGPVHLAKSTFDGRFWQLDGATMEPKPFQKPYPPIWFGANHPNALRRAVQHGDGFFGAGSTTTARFAEQVQVVRAALAEAGRDADAFPIAKRVYIAVDDDARRARQQVADGLEQLYRDFSLPDLTPVAVFGPPDACAHGLRDRKST